MEKRNVDFTEAYNLSSCVRHMVLTLKRLELFLTILEDPMPEQKFLERMQVHTFVVENKKATFFISRTPSTELGTFANSFWPCSDVIMMGLKNI